jgi:hypothetical protein
VGVIIGMDPHKRSATIEVVDDRGQVLAVGRYGTDKSEHCTSWPSSSCATPLRAAQAAGKTPMEAMRALKRRLSNVVYAQMLTDQNRREATGPGGHSGTTLQSSVTDLTPDIGSSDKPLPGPATTQPKHLVIAAS